MFKLVVEWLMLMILPKVASLKDNSQHGVDLIQSLLRSLQQDDGEQKRHNTGNSCQFMFKYWQTGLKSSKYQGVSQQYKRARIILLN